LWDIRGFRVPAGGSVFQFFPAVLWTIGSLFPVSPADQDLFLRLWGPNGPVVSSSTLGVGFPDSVWTVWPLFPVVPWYQIFGFTGGTCRQFTAYGY
jgi:hypothetical protein